MEQMVKEKLEKVVELVNNMMADPDIDIEFCVPDVKMDAESCNVSGDPYILVQYSEDKYVTKKIHITEKYIEYSAEEIAKLVTFSIEQFKQEIDSVQMG